MRCSCGNAGPKAREQGTCYICWLQKWYPRAIPSVRAITRKVPVEVKVGPGTIVAEILKQRGIAPKPGCGCNKIMHEMNSAGVEGCRARVDEFASRMKDNRKFMSWSDRIAAIYTVGIGPAIQTAWTWLTGKEPPEQKPYLSFKALILDACNIAEQRTLKVLTPNEAQGASQLKLLQAAEVAQANTSAPPRPWGSSLVWAVGVTAVPSRFGDLLPRTLASLERAGFPTPRLFIDGGENWAEDHQCTYRVPRTCPWTNWWLGLTELYHRNPEADRFVMVQDDVVFVRNVRQYLELVPWMPKTYLNLCTINQNLNLALPHRPKGFVEANVIRPSRNLTGEALRAEEAKRLQGGKGALCLVFDRDALMTLLGSKDAVERPSAGGGFALGRAKTRIDGGVVDSLNKAGFREMVHNPSLVQHIGTVSTIVVNVTKDGREVRNGNKKDRHGHSLGEWSEHLAKSFPGEEFDALSLLDGAELKVAK